MRTTCLVIGLSLAACGGATTTTAPSNQGSAATATAAKAPAGSSGMPGLDWGASSAAVTAAYPKAQPNQDGGLWYPGNVDGIEALTTFKLGAHGLAEIDIDYTSGFVSMEDCAGTWRKLRAKYDGRFGASQSDNLAAYWTTPTASIQLACNLNDINSSGVLSLHYTPPEKK